MYSLFSLFIIDDKKLKRAYIGEIVDIFAELITKNNKYHLLKKINNLENIRIIIRDEMLTKKEQTLVIYIKEEKNYLTLLKIGKMKEYYLKNFNIVYVILLKNIFKFIKFCCPY